MVRRFRNKVRISEVQEEFDKLCSRIDNLNQVITDVQGFGDDFDYSVGSSQLSPSGYTLTIGGLRTALEGADGKVVGGKAFRINSNQIKMTTGMLVTKDGAYKLPDSVLTVPDDKHTLYYNTTTKQYQWTGTGTESVVVERTREISTLMTRAVQDIPTGNPCYYLPTSTQAVAGAYTLVNPKYSYHWGGPIEFWKRTTDRPEISEDEKSLKLSLEYYPHSVGFGFLKNNSKIYLYQPYNNAYPTTLVMGYYDGVTKYFTPKLIFDACTNGSGTGANLLTAAYNYSGFRFSEGSEVDDCAALHFTYDSDADGREGDITTTLSGYEEPALLHPEMSLGRLTFSKSEGGAQSVNYTLLYTGEDGRDSDIGTATLPFNIEDLNINCILLSSKTTAVDTNGEAPTSTTPRDYYRSTSIQFPYSDLAVYNTNNGAELTAGLNLIGQTLTYYETIVVPSDTAAYRICDINMNRDSIYVSDHLGIQCENIYGTYKIKSESRQYSGDWKYDANGRSEIVAGHWHWGQIGNGFLGYEAANNNSAPKFIVPLECDEMDDGLRYEAYFSDKRISYNKCRPRGADNWYSVANFFYLPKGAPCPFNYKMQQGGDTWNPAYYNVRTTNPTECSSQKSYNVKISKTLKQKTS